MKIGGYCLAPDVGLRPLSIFPDKFCAFTEHLLAEIDASKFTSIVANAVAKVAVLDRAIIEEYDVFQRRIDHAATFSKDNASGAFRFSITTFFPERTLRPTSDRVASRYASNDPISNHGSENTYASTEIFLRRSSSKMPPTLSGCDAAYSRRMGSVERGGGSSQLR